MITIIGPGALGTLFAAKLWTKNKQINLLDYKIERASSLSTYGIRLVADNAELIAFPQVTVDPTKLGKQEFVLVLVKAHQTKYILNPLKKLCSKDTLVISLQNGIGVGDILKSVVSSRNIVLGTTTHGANIGPDGIVKHAGTGITIIGKYEMSNAVDNRLNIFARILSDAGFETLVVEDIYPYLWKKLLVNVGINPLTAICGLKNGMLLDKREIKRIQEMAVREAYSILEAAGIDIGMTVEEVLEFVKEICIKTSDNISSMLQDRIKGVETEINFINGAILKEARMLGMAAPVNEILTNLVVFYSKTGWKSYNNELFYNFNE